MDCRDQLLGELAWQEVVEIQERALVIERLMQLRRIALRGQALKMRGQRFVEGLLAVALNWLVAERTRGQGIDG